MKKIFLILSLILYSCELPDTTAVYQNKLVVFSNLNIIQIDNLNYLSDIKPVRVSMSSPIISEVDDSNELYINDAIVTMEGNFDVSDSSLKRTIEFISMPNEEGKYLGQYQPDVPSDLEFLHLYPNKKYTLNVNYNDPNDNIYEISASTITPKLLEIFESISGDWICAECSDPTIFGETNCENQGKQWQVNLEEIPSINVNNFSEIYSENPEIISQLLLGNLDEIDTATITNIFTTYASIIDEIELERYGCKVGSFASLPYFIIDFNYQNASATRVLSYALEPNKMGLEPLNDIGTFFDYNENKIQDMTRINTFYDTTTVFKLWKGPYLRDQYNNPYLPNPFIWNINVSPSPIMWLYFNYYGQHLMMVQSSDQAYYDYLSGDPLGSNLYILPDSNIEDGYGLFSSTTSKPFFVNVKKAD
tara:strand:- start:50 stop:1306 length:1257 start_codon:yes stop_codon:yes gene_type:complete